MIPTPPLSTSIRRLRRLGATFNPPASDGQMDRLRKLAGAPLPEAIERLYRHHNGMEALPLSRDYRLASVEECEEFIPVYRRWWESDLGWQLGFVPFFTNDESDVAGFCLRGPLQGIMCFAEHDGTPFYLGYRSLEGFFADLARAQRSWKPSLLPKLGDVMGSLRDRLRDESIEEALEERLANLFRFADGRFARLRSSTEYFELRNANAIWERREPSLPEGEEPAVEFTLREMRKDFGVEGQKPTVEMPEDVGRLEELWGLLRAHAGDESKHSVARSIAGLTPDRRMADLLPLLHGEGDWFATREAFDCIAFRRWEPAVPHLIAMVRERRSHWSYALRVLARFRSGDVLDAAIDFVRSADRPTLRESFFEVSELLARNGCEVLTNEAGEGCRRMQYRLPRSGKWELIVV